MKIERAWAMPSKDTFSIPPIAALLDKYISECEIIVDPFARNSTRANMSNDLFPDTAAIFHMEAVPFLDFLISKNIRADAVLFDPPYSPRQISEVYKSVGKAVGMRETQNGRLYKEVKDRLAVLLKPAGIAISCGWNSAGFGPLFCMEEILLVAHGGAHNDTIVVVSRK